MKIGLLGGTFDPPHNGHLALARAARKELRLDRVWLVPAARSPFKAQTASAPARHRLKMVRLLARGAAGFSVGDMEVRRGGTSYSARTVRNFRKRFPKAEIFLILGGDAAGEFTKWRSWKFILKNVRLAVALRPASPVRLPLPIRRHAVLLKSRMPSISSTEIREAVRRGPLTRGWMPAGVARYIRRHGLYSPL
jgi:nicotinate-nucleotide adenylyltransferase